MAHASLRLLLPVALFSSCGRTSPINIADPRTWFMDPNELIHVNITQNENFTTTIATPEKVNFPAISSSSVSTNSEISSEVPIQSVIPSSATKLSLTSTELTSPSKVQISMLLLPVNEAKSSNVSVSNNKTLPRFHKSEDNWTVNGTQLPTSPEISSKRFNFSAPTNTTPSKELQLQVLPSTPTIQHQLDSSQLILSQHKLQYLNISSQLKLPNISNISITSKPMSEFVDIGDIGSVLSQETTVTTPDSIPAVSSEINDRKHLNISLHKEPFDSSMVPNVQQNLIEEVKTQITPVNILESSKLTIPLQSTTTEQISPLTVSQDKFKSNFTSYLYNPIFQPNLSAETPANSSFLKENESSKANETIRKVEVRVLETPVNVFMSSQMSFQSTDSTSSSEDPKIKSNTHDDATSINNSTTPSNIQLENYSVKPNHTIFKQESPLLSTNSYNYNSTIILTDNSYPSSMTLAPPATLSSNKAPVKHANLTTYFKKREPTIFIGNLKSSKRKRRLRSQKSTKTDQRRLKNCNQCELCTREKPICAKPVGVQSFDNQQLRGFPSMCHLECSNSCRKIRYEKVADGRCGRLRDRFLPLGSTSKLNRAEITKLEYQVASDSRSYDIFLPLK